MSDPNSVLKLIKDQDINFVDFPIAIGSTPVTAGSRVPECPIFLIPNTFLSLFTQS